MSKKSKEALPVATLEQSSVTKWEFMTFILTDDVSQAPAFASIGGQGWELVAVVGIGTIQKLFFKRQVV